MKRIIILCALILTRCSSWNTAWDSGATRQESYQQQRMEEQTERLKIQNPLDARPIPEPTF